MLVILLAFCEKRKRKGKWLGVDNYQPLKHVPSILYHEYRFLGQILMKLLLQIASFAVTLLINHYTLSELFVFSSSMKDVFINCNVLYFVQ